ncbi:MAG TPA: glycosyltransferase family 4 protein [Acidimicrobiales bacterium]|nr:glycosyltransferase family 4 protein [Acidimicrobiales bacterium]
MKVLLVHARYALPGGEEQVVDTQEATLTRLGHSVIRYEEPNADLDVTGVTAKARATGSAVWSRAARVRVAGLIASAAPDVVHVHNTFPRVSPSVYVAANAARVPVVQHLHNARLVCIQPFLVRDGAPCDTCVGRLPLAGVVHRCYRQSLPQSAVAAGVQVTHRAIGTWRRRVTRFVAVSESLAETYRASGVVPGSKLVVCENGLAVDPGRRDPSLDHGYALFVGRLSYEKGVDTLIDAAGTLPDLRVVIAGDGPERGALEHAARDMANVVFTGQVDRARVSSLMRGARVLVAPSRGIEPFGLTVVEAAAMGVPAIVARSGALADLVGEGATGCVVAANDPPALRAALERMSAAEMAQPLGDAARAVFEQRFAPDAYGRRLVRLYDDVLAHAP